MGKSREIARLPNAPAFSAYANAQTSLASGAQTMPLLTRPGSMVIW